jgi:hypothetical protein
MGEATTSANAQHKPDEAMEHSALPRRVYELRSKDNALATKAPAFRSTSSRAFERSTDMSVM